MWTFGRKIAAGFGLAIVLFIAIGASTYRTVDTLTTTSYQVAHTHQVIEGIHQVLGHLRDAETGQRGFVITGDDAYLSPYEAATLDMTKTLQRLRELTADNPRQQKRLDDLEPVIATKLGELLRTIDIRRTGGFEPTQKAIREGRGKTAMDQARAILGEMERDERDLLARRADDVEAAASAARKTIVLGSALCLVLMLIAGFTITRSLSAQIVTAVRHMQSSSSELHAAASQQATGAKEQATAMTEITTTINELLATSRQIAESAQRVAKIAQDTSAAARAGDGTVKRSNLSLDSIRTHVDGVVEHMLELGKKSQQIGSVLEILAELAEQTNILAINASIEAAGAGDAGKRFGVVADEIRKLADRVGRSTKDVRALVDDVRAAVNATVMATEGGKKAVEAGSKEFGDVTTSLDRIVSLASTTTEAAREIELSTKQQSTAVEQVNIAIGSVTQAARETESSSTQTVQTAAELTTLARALTRVVQSESDAA